MYIVTMYLHRKDEEPAEQFQAIVPTYKEACDLADAWCSRKIKHKGSRGALRTYHIKEMEEI